MTQVNYNDGKWHGWNGGECPVHPKTVVECVLLDKTNIKRPLDVFDNRPVEALRVGQGCWEYSEHHKQIIAFRVIKEHREPREFWLTSDFEVYTNHEEAQRNSIGLGGVIHVREVLE